MKIKQPSFFSDKQVRKFTLKEKFEYIFKQLNLFLQPVTTKTSERMYDAMKHKYKTITFINCDSYSKAGINSIDDMEVSFTDMKIKADHEFIEITGEKFCYKFPPEMMPEIWRRLKRML